VTPHEQLETRAGRGFAHGSSLSVLTDHGPLRDDLRRRNGSARPLSGGAAAGHVVLAG
jgi:hypothetical protein